MLKIWAIAITLFFGVINIGIADIGIKNFKNFSFQNKSNTSKIAIEPGQQFIRDRDRDRDRDCQCICNDVEEEVVVEEEEVVEEVDDPAVDPVVDPNFVQTVPIILVHGWDVFNTGFSANYWNRAINFLVQNGYNREMIIAKTMSVDNEKLCSNEHAKVIAQWVDDALAAFPDAEKVDLIGHSRGGMNILRALWDEELDPIKVRKVITIAGVNRDCNLIPEDEISEIPGDIQYTSIYSTGDRLVSKQMATFEGALMVEIEGVSHVAMVRNTKVLREVLSALISE